MTDTPPPPDPSTDGRLRLAPGVWIARAALRFKAVRASGPGGQNVNKRSTRVELRVDLADLALGEAATKRLRRLASHLVTEGDELILTSEDQRSQKRNRDACEDKLRDLVLAARVRPKTRKATKPTLGSKRRRLEAKKQRGELKRRRKPPGSGD